jgi:hypothetical protein
MLPYLTNAGTDKPANTLNLANKNLEEFNYDDEFINIENAKKEWEDAKNIFENVSHPDLVDYAIYRVEAAEQKYVYLLKQYRNNNLT